jgi:type IX secretion system PorP/SprF family membrane protein
VRTFLILLSFVCLLSSRAGTYPFYYYLTQHTQNQLLYNPAYAGSSDKLNLHLHSMTGIYKVTGTASALNPLNVGYGSFDRPCPTIKGAWGAYVVFNAPNTAGSYYTLNAGGNYAYRWQINDDHRLQFGAGIAYRRFFSNTQSTLTGNDPIVTGRASSNHMDFSLGAWYQFKKLNAGISVSHLGNFYISGIGGNFIGNYSPIMNAYLSYNIELIEKLHIEPYLYFASASTNSNATSFGQNAQFSVGFMADYDKGIFVGLGYSANQAISPTAGFQLKKKFRFQGTYNYISNQQDAFLRYHNFEVSLTVQLAPKEKERNSKKVD